MKPTRHQTSFIVRRTGDLTEDEARKAADALAAVANAVLGKVEVRVIHSSTFTAGESKGGWSYDF